MRIISGFAKGRKLYTPQNDKVIRPTADRAKEALFNIISDKVESAKILDLFAGTGALGIEALSRGAAAATFVDNGREALKLIEKNIAILLQSLPQSSECPAIDVIKSDILRFNFRSGRLKIALDAVDIIFMDPPYSKGFVEKVLRKLDQAPDCKPEMLFIAEERSSEKPPQDLSSFSLIDQRRYGDTVFWIYQFFPSHLNQ